MRLEITRLEGRRNDLLLRIDRTEIATVRLSVDRAIATYDGNVCGAEVSRSARCARTVSTSPRTIGPVRAASPWLSALSSAA